MTNYNEKLDEVLDFIENYGVSASTEGFDKTTSRTKAKQAITSLTKELVAEAKPDDFLPKGHHPDACLNHVRYTSACCGCQKQRARNYAIDEFEQNLLKELEEL